MGAVKVNHLLSDCWCVTSLLAASSCLKTCGVADFSQGAWTVYVYMAPVLESWYDFIIHS